MTDEIICKIYFEKLNSQAAYLRSFSHDPQYKVRKSKGNMQILD